MIPLKKGKWPEMVFKMEFFFVKFFYFKSYDPKIKMTQHPQMLQITQINIQMKSDCQMILTIFERFAVLYLLIFNKNLPKRKFINTANI